MTIYAGTGHRPEKLFRTREYAYAFHNGGFDRLVLFAESVLVEKKPETVITGMAMGWDMALALACSHLHIPYIAAVPFAGQERIWRPQWQYMYAALLNGASNVEVVSEGGFTARKMMLRNIWMVDHADSVLALYNGEETGGTAQCLQYCTEKGVHYENLWWPWMFYKQEHKIVG